MEREGGGRPDPGDDSAIVRVVAVWANSIADVTGSAKGAPHLAHIRKLNDGLELVLAVQRGPDRRQVHFVKLGASGWGLLRLSAGVYDVTPSIHVPGQFHGFVTVVGVPELPRWG